MIRNNIIRQRLSRCLPKIHMIKLFFTILGAVVLVMLITRPYDTVAFLAGMVFSQYLLFLWAEHRVSVIRAKVQRRAGGDDDEIEEIDDDEEDCGATSRYVNQD